MNADHNAPSVFLLSDLAIRAAVELERQTSGETVDGDVLDALASALRRTSEPLEANVAFHFVEPGYYSPFQWLFRTQESRQSGRIEDIQAFILRTSEALEGVETSGAEGAAELQKFCLDLHQALIRELTAESGFVIHDGGLRDDPAEACLRTA